MKKIFLILSILFALLFVSLWVYVQSDAFEFRIRPLIAVPLQQVLGPGAVFGRIKANLLPLSLEVRDIVIRAPGSSGSVEIRRIRLYVNPFPLLYRTISIPSIAVLEPRITATRSPEGVIDLSALIELILKNIKGMQHTGESAFSVNIRTITIRNGKAVFSDRGSNVTAAASRMNMKLKLFPFENSFDARLSSADLSLTAPAIREFKGQIRGVIDYDRGQLSLDGCELSAEDARIAASGVIRIMTGGGLDLKITSRIGQRSISRITDLLERRKKAKGAVIESTVKISGTLKDPIMSGSVDIEGIEVRGVRLDDAKARFAYQHGRLSLEGDHWKMKFAARQLNIQSFLLDASYLNGSVQIAHSSILADDLALHAAGSVGPADGYQLELSASSSSQGKTLSMLCGFEIAGPVTVRGSVSGPLASPHFDGQLDAGHVIVRGVPFNSISGNISYKDMVLSLNDSEINQGHSRYDLGGSVDFHGIEPKYQARLDAFRSDVVNIVALFYKKIPLDITASGILTFSGTGREYAGTARLELEAGSAYGESFDRGRLSAELTTGRISFPRVVLEKKSGSAIGKGWIGFDGTYEAHIESKGQDLSEVDHLKLLSCSGPFILDIRSSGSFSAPVVNAYATSEQLSYRNVVLGSASMNLFIQDAKLTFTSQMSAGLFSANGSWYLKAPYPWSLSADMKLQNADLSALLAGSEILAKMRVLAEGSLQAKGKGIDAATIEGSARLQKLGLVYGDLRLENEGAADIRFAAGRVFVHSLTLAGPGTKLAVSGASQIGEDVDLTFTGDANLSLLRVLFREIDHGDGTASIKLTVSEDWSNPDIAGELTVRNGVIKIRDIPQKFTALNGTISFINGKVVTESLNGEVGGGMITISGNAQLHGSELLDFSTKASIENVTVRYPPGLTANVGGVLYYDGDANTQTLSGEIQLRRARYEKRVEWKSMLVDFSKGFTQKKKADIGWIGETQLGVRFIGREHIMLESNLAKIPLDIDMQIQGTVNQPHILGRLEARKGEVYFRKNVFKILHASADFTDPNRINPTLDVRAETRVREYLIQLGVTGTADRAVVTFVSEPPLTDSNILALLTLGRKSEDLKGKEANVGVGEATSFATGKFQDILESRARSLTGLDRFQVDPYISKTDTAVPRITVGKELMSDKLFLTYSSNVGATYPEQVFRIEYLLNRNISLVGDRNEVGNLGADVKFRFEFR